MPLRARVDTAARTQFCSSIGIFSHFLDYKPIWVQYVVSVKATETLTHSDIKSRLKDALPEGCDLEDIMGDDQSGDVVYCDDDGSMWKAPYEISQSNGKATASVDDDNAVKVSKSTSYDEHADDDDHYASMEESFKRGNIYTDLPLYERFISKDERANAGEGSFAGKGKSFPILKPQDVMAAVHAMGRAGSGNYGMAALKANIIRIAKRKGWTKYLPKSWQNGGSDTSESAAPEHAGTLALRESAATLEPIILREARADYEIKLIAPGKGSSAFYPAEVLKRDGPKVFKAGTHVYLNHPTPAEEAARPEGDVANLAGVLTTAATYHEAHAKGPGLYARMKVFADHGQMVEEKAPHVGMSIRAMGEREADKVRDGVPVLKELTSAESVDVVTRAGAGGMILTEAAKPATGEVELTLQEAQAMVTKAVGEATAPFQRRLIEADAEKEISRIMRGSNLHADTLDRIVEESLRDIPTKDGALDTEKFRESVVKIAQREAEYAARLSGGGRVLGLGPSVALPLNEADRKAEKKRLKEAKAERKEAKQDLRESFAVIMGGDTEAAKRAARGREDYAA
jgi:hypothetical protein